MAQIAHLDIGDWWVAQATFTKNDVPTDPSTLFIKVKDPAGTITTTTESSPATLLTSSNPTARMQTGSYRFFQPITVAGHWYLRFEGTGSVIASEEHEAIVDPSPFYDSGGVSDRALVSLGEAKDWLGSRLIDTNNDLRIVECINGASEKIMATAGREFKAKGTNPQERSFDIYDATGVVRVGDLQTISTASTSADAAACI